MLREALRELRRICLEVGMDDCVRLLGRVRGELGPGGDRTPGEESDALDGGIVERGAIDREARWVYGSSESVLERR